MRPIFILVQFFYLLLLLSLHQEVCTANLINSGYNNEPAGGPITGSENRRTRSEAYDEVRRSVYYTPTEERSRREAEEEEEADNFNAEPDRERREIEAEAEAILTEPDVQRDRREAFNVQESQLSDLTYSSPQRRVRRFWEK